MKQYVIRPQYKKSIAEWTTFRKEIDGTRYTLQREVGWRWGTFIINVPETDEEIKAFMEQHGYEDMDVMLDDFGVTSLEEMCLPEEGDDDVELDSYDYEMVDCWDGCWEDFNLQCYGEEVDEDEQEAIVDEARELYEEGYEEALEDAGWEQALYGYNISGGFTLTEVPAGVDAYEFINENQS